MAKQATQGKPEKVYCNVRFDPEVRKRAKAAAHWMGEDYYQFIETAVCTRLDELKQAGKIPF